jgi:hypothetical protein
MTFYSRQKNLDGRELDAIFYIEIATCFEILTFISLIMNYSAMTDGQRSWPNELTSGELLLGFRTILREKILLKLFLPNTSKAEKYNRKLFRFEFIYLL